MKFFHHFKEFDKYRGMYWNEIHVGPFTWQWFSWF
jgi:hypothetical protein